MKQFTSLYFAFFLLILTTNVRGQDSGIVFKSYRSWDEIKAEAKITNKMIFVDCYATWCGPCKMMDREIYSNEEVGNYFNTHFINVKLQMDHTPKDNQQAKDFYPVTDSIAAQLGVNAYPTFLFFSSDGIALHKFVGVTETAQDFINRSTDALDPNKQYFTILLHLPNHPGDSVFQLNAIAAAKNAGDDDKARLLANEYIGNFLQPITKSKIELIDPYIQSEYDKGFAWYVQNALAINQTMGEKSFAEETLSAVIFKEEITPNLSWNSADVHWKEIEEHIEEKYPQVDKNLLGAALASRLKSAMEEQVGLIYQEEVAPRLSMNGPVIHWKNILVNIETRYPAIDKNYLSMEMEAQFKDGVSRAIAKEITGKDVRVNEWDSLFRVWKKQVPDYDIDQIVLNARVKYYASKKSWEECGRATISLLDKYAKKLGPRSVNDLIWNIVFQHVSDPTTLKKAIKYMENVIRLAPDDPGDLDTYANLIYKSGHKQEAMDLENKAIDIAKNNNEFAGDFKTALKKMQEDSITWEAPGLN